MTGENKYSTLRQAAILMALDTGGAVAEAVLLLVVVVLLGSADSRTASPLADAAKDANVYVSWTLWGLRLLIWSLTAVLLSHMTDLCKSFGKARIWYFLRILAFIVVMIFAGVVTSMSQDAGPEREEAVLPVLSGMILLDMGLNLLTEALLLPLGNGAILRAGAELLESFGLEKAAKENRRCGRRIIGFVAAYAFFLVFAFVLLAGLRFAGTPLFSDRPDAGGVSEILIWLDMAAFLLCLPTWLGMEAFRILAAVCMNHTYRAIRELTE